MAINRAETYQVNLPDPQVMQQLSASQRQPANAAFGGIAPDKMDEYFGIPKPAEGLQRTGDLALKAAEYYKKRNDLQQFARTQWLKNKIDVTAPDPSNQAAVIAAQIYNMGLADIMNTGDALVTGQKMLAKPLELQQQGLFQFEKGAFDRPYSENLPQQSGYSLAVDPTVKAGMDAINKDFTSFGAYQGAQGLARGVQGDTAQAAATGGAREALVNRQAQLLRPDYNPDQPRAGGSGSSSPISGLATEWAQLSVGKHPTFRVTEKLGKSGSFVSESTNNSFINKQYGQYLDQNGVPRPFIIARLERDNDTGDVTAFTAEGIAKPLPKDNIDISMRQVIDKSQVNEYEQYLKDLSDQGLLPRTKGAGGASSFVVPPSLFVPQSDEQASIQAQQQAQAVKPLVEEIRNKISSDLDILDSSFWNTWNPFSDVPSELEYDSNAGKLVVVKKDGKYQIKIDGKVRDFGNKANPVKTLTKPQMQDVLRQYEVDNLILKDKYGKVIANPSKLSQQIPEGFTPEEWGVLTQEEKDDYLKQ